MDPLYYIQVGDIHPPEENRLRILIDWGGLKGLGRKGLKDLKGSKGVKSRQKDQKEAMASSSCSRSQLLQLWRTRKRPQRPKKIQPERWPPKRISEGWSSAKRAMEKLRDKGLGRWFQLIQFIQFPQFIQVPRQMVGSETNIRMGGD